MPIYGSTAQSVRAQSLRPYSFLLKIAAGIGVALSVYFTVLFCARLRGEGFGVVPAGLGLFFEICKYAFAPLGLAFLGFQSFRDRLVGVVLCVTATMLIFGSTLASVGFLGELDSDIKANALQSSRQYQALETQASLLSRQLETLTVAAAQDAERGYRARALRASETASEMRAELADVHTRIASLSASGNRTNAASPLVFFVSLGGGEALSQIVHLLLAVALEVSTVLAIFLSSNALRAQAKAKRPEQCTERSTLSVSAVAAPKPQPNFKAYIARARVLAKSGKLHPTYRGIQKEFGVGQRAAKAVIESLKTEGLITQTERGYALAQ